MLGVPNDPELVVRANGAVMVGAGSMLALGRLPRRAALALALSLLPTTAAGHPFWQIKDPKQRAAQRLQLQKNLSMLGGLLLAVVDTGGKPGLGGGRAEPPRTPSARPRPPSARPRGWRAARREAHVARHHVADALPLV